jgi:hypothetical protein
MFAIFVSEVENLMLTHYFQLRCSAGDAGKPLATGDDKLIVLYQHRRGIEV